MSETALVPRNGTVAIRPGLTEEQTDLIKRTICRGATDDELQLFVHTCNRLQLDPFARQICAVKRWDSRERREVMSIQVTIDGFRLVAERTGCYAPGKTTEFEMNGRAPVRATAYVKKFSHGEWHEVGEEAYFEEYAQTSKEGAPTAMWARMPRVMIAKCAEARALRRAFPAELGGIYAPEEMAQATNPTPAPANVIDMAEFQLPPADPFEQAFDDSETPHRSLEERINDAAALADLTALLPDIKKADNTERARLRPIYSARQSAILKGMKS